jgi:3-oxoadipate enol-lactonase/4-carboxymuconolactone decarboxylase
MTVDLHHQTDGPDGAPVLVLLNSLGTTSAMWDPQLAALSEQFRVVTVDIRGHGRSPASPALPTGQSPDIADLGRDVLALLDRLDAPRVHLAGLSLGGMTAMWLAAHHPERIARLALLCTSAHLPPKQGWLERANTVRRHGMSAIADAVVARWTTPGLAERDPDLVARLVAMLTSVDPESYAQCCEAIATLDLRADLGRIAAPTLVISGAADLATPPDHGELIADGVRGSRLEIVGPAAHLATYEQSGPIGALLLEHFGGGDRLRAGYATRRSVLGDVHVDAAVARTTEFTAPFQDFITRYAWGDIWTRPGLSRRDRSIATLAALISIGAEHEIGMHVRAALTNGLTPAEISEVLLHTAVYSGLPRANRAFALAQQALDEAIAPPTTEET